jgi:hypothetical protein
MSKLQELRGNAPAEASLPAGSITVGIPKWYKADVAGLTTSASRRQLPSLQGETAT